jgi:iron complex transport system permease protein
MFSRFNILFILLLGILCISFLIQVLSGPAGFSFQEMAIGLIKPSSPAGSILWKIRIPRAAFGILLGAGLAVCGLSLQGLFRNPLAEPFTLGISSGAGFGAVLAIVLGVSTGILISIFSFVGALGVTLLVFLLVQRTLFSQTSLILCGVMVGYFFQSALMLLLAMSPSNRAHGAIMWLMGDLNSAPPQMLLTTTILCLVGCIFLIRKSSALDLLSMGEEKAASLGVNIPNLRRHIFFWSSLVTGACVASVGVVGFVGLIIPHALRNIVGPKHTTLYPLCIIGGSAFILICDFAARSIMAPIVLPLGVITGLIGSITFLWIFIQKGV